MIGRLAGVLFACVCLTLCVGSASAEVPAGARLTFIEASAAGFKLVSVDPDGADRRVIVGGNRNGRFLPFPFGRPSWTGDGARLVFAGISHPRDMAGRIDLYTASADGTEVTRLPGTSDSLSAVVSPDGSTLAFAREREWDVKKPHEGRATEARSVSIWLLDIDRRGISQLTPWRDGLSAYPSSFSPDGSILAISRQWGNRHAAVAVRLDGSGETVLARNASEPVYSPDGTRLAMTTLGKRRSIGRKGGNPDFLADRPCRGRRRRIGVDEADADAKPRAVSKLGSLRTAARLHPADPGSGRRLLLRIRQFDHGDQRRRLLQDQNALGA